MKTNTDNERINVNSVNTYLILTTSNSDCLGESSDLWTAS